MLNNKGEDVTDLCINNYGLLKSIVGKRCYINGVFNHELYEDLLSYCTISYVEACRDYNKETGYKFSTFATKYINNKILNYFKIKNAKKRNFEGVLISLDSKYYKYEKGKKLTYEEVIEDKKSKNKYTIFLKEIENYVFYSNKFNEIEIEYYKSLINNTRLKDLTKKYNYKSSGGTSRFINAFHRKINQRFNPNGDLFYQLKI